MFNCEFCDNSFTSKFNLQYHQQNTKYCLDKQNEIKSISLQCESCNKYFKNKYNLNKHYTTCIDYKLLQKEKEYNEKIEQMKTYYEEKIEDIVKSYEDRIKDYKEMYIETLNRVNNSSNSNSNNVNNIINFNNIPSLTQEIFLQILDKIPIDIQGSSPEIFAIEFSKYLTDFVFYIDKARGHVVYKFNDKWEIDKGSGKFSNIVLKNTSNKIINNLHNSIVDNCKKIDHINGNSKNNIKISENINFKAKIKDIIANINNERLTENTIDYIKKFQNKITSHLKKIPKELFTFISNDLSVDFTDLTIENLNENIDDDLNCSDIESEKEIRDKNINKQQLRRYRMMRNKAKEILKRDPDLTISISDDEEIKYSKHSDEEDEIQSFEFFYNDKYTTDMFKLVFDSGCYSTHKNTEYDQTKYLEYILDKEDNFNNDSE